MGEYWKPVNLDKGQQVHPHLLGEGLKRPEWLDRPDSRTHRRVRELLASGEWSGADEVRAVSDCGDSQHLSGPTTERTADYYGDWDDVPLPTRRVAGPRHQEGGTE